MTNDMIPIRGNGKRMSSREIAELTGKRHDNVMRVCRDLKAAGVCPQIEETPFTLPATGQTYIEFHFDKRDSLVLVARLSPEFTAKVVDRWQELEDAVSAPRLNDNAWLRAALLEYTGKVETLTAQIQEAKPKSDFYDRFARADGLYTLQNCGRIITGRPNKFIQELKRDYLFYQGGNLVPKVQYRQRGLFEVKVEMVDDKARPQTFVTPKGLQFFTEKMGGPSNG